MAVPSQPLSHPCCKWDTCWGSSAPCLSRIFVSDCMLFLVPLYNALFPPSFFLHLWPQLPLLLRDFLACQCCPLLCSVLRLSHTRSAGRGEMFPAPGAALWPEISSPLTLNWLGQCSELSSAQGEAGSAPWRCLQLPEMNLAPGAWGSFLPSLWAGWKCPRAAGGTGL